MSSIYGLYDRDGQLRYIGKANNPEERLKSHMRETTSGRRNYPVNLWIRKNGRPEMRVLSENCEDWRSEERRLIAEARARGDRLLNIADGGDEPHCSTETRRANALKMQAHPNAIKQRRINAKKMNDAMAADPVKMRVRQIRLQLRHALRAGHISPEKMERWRKIAHYCEQKKPELFRGFEAMFQ